MNVAEITIYIVVYFVLIFSSNIIIASASNAAYFKSVLFSTTRFERSVGEVNLEISMRV